MPLLNYILFKRRKYKIEAQQNIIIIIINTRHNNRRCFNWLLSIEENECRLNDPMARGTQQQYTSTQTQHSLHLFFSRYERTGEAKRGALGITNVKKEAKNVTKKEADRFSCIFVFFFFFFFLANFLRLLAFFWQMRTNKRCHCTNKEILVGFN